MLWYEHANLIISPIFSGSGMKSKVGEAMMFGKKYWHTKIIYWLRKGKK
jgi:hypothetical protein